ncbi:MULTISPECIES: amino acid-binding protein [Cupriavidus]|uniref:Amino acid-binding protein n=1 Tax=Cupriavidus oxalaticus TaxID=96344 RepID=A0A4P7LHJ6_9BURK|nr:MULTISPECIES: amino acid-binding protein [Cupriavidus]MBF6989495.1 amino acid-binding protein [Cupriavidus sp. IK-TO18]QBY55704.1 amino acid-binding protein [Cupriavidus oxalaticus]TDF67367.1 amino acid-binding protein [Cupriavidus sp. L7L]
MELLVEQVEVWAASIPDKPGGLAGVLTTLRDVGADLQFIIARRSPDRPGESVVFVTPLQGEREMVAAAIAGFNLTQKQHCVRVMGQNIPGLAAALTEDLAEARINLRGFSAAVIGTQFVAYVAVDSLAEADLAADVLKAVV